MSRRDEASWLVSARRCFFGGNDLRRMKMGWVSPSSGGNAGMLNGRILLLHSVQHFKSWRGAFGELVLLFFPPSPQLCHLGCNGTSCGFGWPPVCSPLGCVVGACF